MGAAVVLGAGLVVLAGLWFVTWRFEREARDRAESLVRDTEQMLSAFDVQVVAAPTERRRRRDGGRKRRRRKKGGGEQRGAPSS